MPQGERGPRRSRRGKDEASDEHRGDRDGRKMFSQVTQVTGKHCSPGPWMGLSRHSCQRVLERQELKQHCTCLPRPSSLPSLCSRPPPPTTLWASCTFDTPTTFLGGPQGSPSSFLTFVSPSPCPVDSLPSLPDTDLALVPLQPSTQGAEFVFYSSEHIGHRFGKTLEPAVGSCGRRPRVLQHGCLLQILLCRHQLL